MKRSRFSEEQIIGILKEHQADDPDFEYVQIDATIVRVHQHAAGKKRGLRLMRSAAHAAG